MKYLALARKYRPQNFDEIVGQDFVVKTLGNAIELGRIAHAYLFTGPRGVGKTSAARIFAKAVNCLSPDGVNPCNKCEYCQEITEGTSMDVIEIDGASNRGIDEIRQLRETVRFIPAKYNYKIYIIDEVHMLTEPAFNALLKTLEEPPEHAIFIMATTDVHRIPATIMSRCQRYDFKKISPDFMFDYLKEILGKEGIDFDEDSLSIIMRNSEGCMRDALSLIDQIVAYSNGSVNLKDTEYLLGLSDHQLVDELFETIVYEKTSQLAEKTEEINLKGMDYSFVIKTIMEYLKHILFAKATGNFPEKELTTEEITYLERISGKIDDNRAFALFQVFQKLLQDLKIFDIQQYVFEFGIFKAASISNVLQVGNHSEKSSADNANTTVKEYSGGKQEQHESTLDSDDKIWETLLENIEEKNPATSANLSHGYIITSDEKTFKVGFSEEKRFHYEIINKREHLSILKDAVKNFFGGSRQVEVVLESTGKKKDLARKKQELETYYEKKMKDEVKKNEMINNILNDFGGEIVDIQVYKKK